MGGAPWRMCMTRRPDGALETGVLRVLWGADGPLLPGDLAVRGISELLDSSSDRAQVLSRFIGGLPAKEAKAIQAMLDRATSDEGKH